MPPNGLANNSAWIDAARGGKVHGESAQSSFLTNTICPRPVAVSATSQQPRLSATANCLPSGVTARLKTRPPGPVASQRSSQVVVSQQQTLQPSRPTRPFGVCLISPVLIVVAA